MNPILLSPKGDDQYSIRSLRQNILQTHSNSQLTHPPFIEVTVKDATNSSLLKSALVEVYNATGIRIISDVTDANGFLNMTDLKLGQYRIEISYSRVYSTETKVVTFNVEGESKRLTFFLIPNSAAKAAVEVQVLDLSDVPLGDAQVTLYDEDMGEISSTVTNSSGFAVLTPLSVANYTVATSKTGYQNKSETFQIEWFGHYQKVKLRLFPANTLSAFIEVYVHDRSTKQMLPFVFVEVHDQFGRNIATQQTDDSGFVNITKLDMGVYTISLHLDTYNDFVKEVILKFPSDFGSLHVPLTPSSLNQGFIEVNVITDDFVPIISAFVELYNLKNELVGTGTTNDFGFYEFTTLECGEYQVTVSASHFFSQTQEVKIRWSNDTRILNFPLDSKQGNTFIQVFLTDQYDQPVKGGIVKLYDSNQNFVHAGLTDDSGFLNLSDIPINTYNLEISKSGYQTKWFFNINPVTQFNQAISHKLVPDAGIGMLNVFAPSNSYVTVSNNNNEVVFSGLSSAETLTVPYLAVGDYVVEVYTEEGSQTHSSSINWMGDVNSVYVDQVTEQMDTSGYMEFTVYEFNVGPIPNCYVTAKSQYDVYYSQVTDQNGFANITGLHIGEYEITVQHTGFVDTVVVHSIDYAGDSSKASIYLYRETFDLEIYITGALTGWPLRGSVAYKFNSEPYSFPQLTDFNGFIRYNNLPVGQYTFCIAVYGYETQFHAFSFMTAGDFQVLHFSMIKYGGNGVEDHFAIILGGGTEDRFTHDARGMYLTLTNHYGFTPENTYLLTCESMDWVSNVPVPYDAITSLSSLTWAVNDITSKADIEDEVIIWWTGHGGYYRSESTGEILDVSFSLNGDWITGTYFNTLIDGITCNRMYFFLGPCHSGYWIEDLWGKGNRVIYTSCDWDEIARAFYEHSYWPRATKRTLDPAYDADEADWNNDNRVSLKELYDYALYWVQIVKNKNQHPQRWVSYGMSDSGLYIGDETYNAGLGATILRSSRSIQYSLADYSIKEETTQSLDEKTGISTCVSVGLLDDELDNDDCFINFYNSSTFLGYSPISDVSLILRFLNGTVFSSSSSDIDGTIIFYDLPDGEFAWEAIYDDREIGSGRFVTDGVKLTVDTLIDNYDRQGDAADLQVQITDQTEATPLMGITLSLYHIDGTFIGNRTSDFDGIAMFFDLSGIFGYEVFYQDTLCAEGTVAIDSSHFTLSTDSTAPEVTILSPTDGKTYSISDLPLQIQYQIIEEYNYSLTVFLNTLDIGYKFNGSELDEILTSGVYTVRIEAVDFAGNLGHDEVSFTLTDDISVTSSTTSSSTMSSSSSSRIYTTTTRTKTTTGNIYWHLGFLQVVCCIFLTLITRRRRKLRY